MTQKNHKAVCTAATNKNECFVLVNRAPKSRAGWIHIVPKGELPHKVSGITQVVDDEAIDAIWNRLQELRANPNWEGLYAGREHFIYDEDKDSEALGWFKNFDRDENGIWAKEDDLTDIGKDAVKNKRYKFTSMVINHSDMQPVGTEEKRFRPLAIDTVGFTNIPNARDLLAPISNRFSETNGNDNFPAMMAGNNRLSPVQTNNERKKMKTVLAELDLSPDASEESALAAVIKLKNRIITLEPFEGENTKLKNRVSDLDTKNVDGLLESRVKDEKVRNTLRPVLVKMEKVEDRTDFLDDCGFKAGATTTTPTQNKLFNRETTSPSGKKETSGTEPSAEDKEVAQKVRNRASELRREMPTLTLLASFQMAQQQICPQ
jgi:Mu-like prophage I protein